MIKALLYTATGEFREDVDLQEISELISNKENLLWLDLSVPTGDELETIKKEFGFHELAIEDATKRHQRPKLDEYQSFYFIVFYALTVNEQTGTIHPSELELFLGPNYLVTVHNGSLQEISRVSDRWRRNTQTIGHNIGVLVYSLLDTIVDDYFDVVDYMSDKVDDIEEQIFDGLNEKALQTIFSLKKQLQSIRRVVTPERDVVIVLTRQDIPVFSPQTSVYFQDVYDHIVRVIDSIDTYRDLLSSALDVYLSTVSNRLNQVMKTLTAVATILMTDGLVAGIYGMNFQNIPELGWDYGYSYALGLMIVLSLALATFFRSKKWF